MKVRLSSEARKDLIAIGDYIARDNPTRASTFVRELVKACVELSSTPLAYPIVQRKPRRAYGVGSMETIRSSTGWPGNRS
jgi:plasmid stabilization system protein ParE